MFYFHPYWDHFDSHFSDGLKPPTRTVLVPFFGVVLIPDDDDDDDDDDDE